MNMNFTSCYTQNNFKGHLCNKCGPCLTMRACAEEADPTGQLWKDIRDNWLVRYMLDFEEKKDREERVRERLSGSVKHKFITISLPKIFDPKKVVEIIDSCRFDYMKNSMFCLEVTGADGAWHPHLHILIEGCPDNTRMIRDLSHLLDIKKNFVDIGLRNYDLYERRKNYILGIKQDKKMDQVKKDTEYLQSNGLEKYYIHV